MPRLTAVHSEAAPMAAGPYSQAVAHSGLLYCSGQLPLDPSTMTIVGTSAAEQIERCLVNLAAVCEAAGTELTRAVKVTVSMTDINQFAEVNEVYGRFFAGSAPARVVLGVSTLPRGATVEVDAVIALDRGATWD